MAFETKYLFVFDSIHGAATEIHILLDGYSGDVIRRSLGRPPVLKKKKSGPVSGTSLEIWSECQVNGEFAELYTSDPKAFRVDLVRNNVTIWTGFVSTELYSEPGIAPPYDVQVVATDGLGELKLNNFEAQGDITIGEMFVYLLSFTGSDRPIDFAWKIKQHGSTVPYMLDSVYVNLDYMAGKTVYDVLVYVLDSFHATITASGARWLVYRETDFDASQVRIDGYYVPAGGGAAAAFQMSGISKSVGKMGVADLWPVGNYTSKIEPARRQVTVKAPWHVDNIAVNPDCAYGQGGWLLSEHANYLVGFGIQIGPLGHFAYAYQEFGLSSLKNSIKISVRVRPEMSASGYEPVLYMYVVYETEDEVYYGDADGWTTEAPSAPRVPHELDYNLGNYPEQRFEDEIPSPNISDPGTLVIYVAGRRALLERAEFYLDPATKGYQDTIHIDNGARGEDDEIEIMHGRILEEEFSYPPLLTGAMKKTVSGSESFVYKFADAHYSNLDFLALITLSYALSAALPRLRREGVIDTPVGLSGLPVFLTIEGVRHLIETYDWDLYNDEMKFSALSLPAAEITVESETVAPLDDSTSGGWSGSGGSSGSGGGRTSQGVSLLRVWKSLTNNDALESYGDDTKIALEHLSSFLEVNEYATGHYALKVKPTVSLNGNTITIDGLFSEGFVTAGGIGSSGGGGGTSVLEVWRSLTNNNQLASYDANTKIAESHIPTLPYLPFSGGQMDQGASIMFDDGGIEDSYRKLILYESGRNTFVGEYNEAGTTVYIQSGAGMSIYHKKGTTNYEIWDKNNLANPCVLVTPAAQSHDDYMVAKADGFTTWYDDEGSTYYLPSASLLSDIDPDNSEILADRGWVTSNFLNTTAGDNRYLKLAGGQMDQTADIQFNDQHGILNLDNKTILAANGHGTHLGEYTASGSVYINAGASGKVYRRRINSVGGVLSHSDYEIWDKGNLPHPMTYTSLGSANFGDAIGLYDEIGDTFYQLPVPTSTFDPDDYSSEAIYSILTSKGGTISGVTGLIISTGPLTVSAGATSLKNTTVDGTLGVTGATTLAAVTASGLATFSADANFTGGIKIGGTALNLVYDTTYSAWKLTGNLMVTGFVTGGGVGSGGGGGGGTSTAEWYNIKMKRRTNGEYEVVTENFTTDLTDGTAYKMVLLRWRKGANRSSSWHAPFLCPSNFASLNSLAQYASWNITGRTQNYLNGTSWQTVIDTTRMTRQPLKFKATRNRKLRFGCAIYKNTGVGTYGWQRISNIAYVELFVNNSSGDLKKSIKVQ